MKKSLIALAVLAATGAASAQSSVTLYGIVDTFVASTNVNPSAAGVGSTSQTVINSGGINGNRWGMKGSEDLGGGLKANFDLESGFSSDTGTQGQGRLFGRQAYVGVSGGFGAVQLGRMSTVMHLYTGAAQGMLDGAAIAPLTQIGRVNDNNQKIGGGANTGATLRFNNALRYTTPSFSGLQATAQYALGENNTAGGDADKGYALAATYKGGPIGVQTAYQVETCNANTANFGAGAGACAVNGTYRRFAYVGAEYNLGMAVLKASYGRAENIAGRNNANSTEYQVGVDVPVSSALLLTASYASADDNRTQSNVINPLAGKASREAYGVGAKYALSKRTYVYTAFEYDEQTQNGVDDYKHRLFALGLNHKF